MELEEGSGVINGALVADSAAELGEVDDVAADAAFVADDSGEEADDGKWAEDFVGQAGEGVGVLHVGTDEEAGAIGLAAAPAGGVEVAEAEKRGCGGFADGGVDVVCLEGGEYRHYCFVSSILTSRFRIMYATATFSLSL